VNPNDTKLPPDAGRSWWLREALAHDPGEECPPLEGEQEADVVIVGGGYTGMWTAHVLKEREPDLDVVLLEQDICGGGPSGRNGGFVNGWWQYLEDVVDLFGERRGLELCRVAEASSDEIGGWCERHGVDAWNVRSGDVGIACSPAQEGRWREGVELARRLGVGDKLVELSAEQVALRCRSPIFRGGVMTPDAGTVHPARLARGLRRVLLEQGVRIHEGTSVRRFAHGSPAVAETPRGRVRAGSAVIAVNAWGAAWRRFRSRLAVRGSYIVLTAPAPERLEEIEWTGGEGLWSLRSAVDYVRTTPDGRMAFGTGGMQPGLARGIGPRFAYDERFIGIVAENLWRMFPGFRDVPLEAAWGGPIDVSGDHVPFFGTLPGGNVHYGLGYTGNGVAPAHLGGNILARLVLGVEDEVTALPIVGFRPRRFPPEPFRSVGALIANEAILRKDAAEDDGRRAGPMTRMLAGMPRRLGYRLGP